MIILASAFAVLGEVYGDLLRAAGATERLMELLASQPSIISASNPTLVLVPPAGSAIEFESINFHYPSRPAQAALQNFSLKSRRANHRPGGTQQRAKARCFSCCCVTLMLKVAHFAGWRANPAVVIT